MSEGKFFFIRSEVTGLVLEVGSGVASPGQPVTPQRCHGGDAQVWWEDVINGCIRSHLDDDFALDVQGNELVINAYSPNEFMQKWQRQGNRVVHLENGNVLDIANNSEDEGARVCAWEEHGGANQQWEFEHLPPKYMLITSQMHGRVLDVREADPSPGNKAIMWKRQDHQPDNQLWYEDRHGYIRSKLTDFSLDFSGNSIELHPFDMDLPTRHWMRAGSRVVNREDTTLCLDIKGADTSKGAKLCGYEYSGAENQLWRFDYV